MSHAVTQLAPIVVHEVSEADLARLRPLELLPGRKISDVRFAHASEGKSLYVMAERDGEPAGSAVLDLSDEDLLPELRHMYVYPTARRTGVGQALAAFIESEAVSRGFDEIFLGVDPENFEAIPLYLHLGYSPTGNHRIIQGEDIVDGVAVPATYHDAIYRKSLRVWT